MATVTFIFHNYLQQLLKKKFRAVSLLVHHFDRRASVKDVIESLGIPHPVIDGLTVNGSEAGFDQILLDNDTVEATPLTAPVNPFIPTILRPVPLKKIAFVVDVNAGKLALFLRMLGFDTMYGNEIGDRSLAEISRSENRILLSRDIDLLKRKIVMHGYLLRQQGPREQLIEVMRLYDLSSKVKPLSRCIPCNGLLVPASKESIMDQLEPLTRKYYHSFHICESCGKIYWPGSHQKKINGFINEILGAVRQDQSADG